MKKINSVLTIITTLILIDHLGAMSMFLLTGSMNPMVTKIVAHALCGVVTLHAILSIISVFFMNSGTGIGKYKSQNKNTIIQRATSIVIAIMVHPHLKAFGFIIAKQPLPVPAKVGLIVTQIIFFGAILLHLAVSFSKALITLGLIRNEKAEKRVNLIMNIICAALTIFSSAALIIFLINWR